MEGGFLVENCIFVCIADAFGEVIFKVLLTFRNNLEKMSNNSEKCENF